MTIRRLLPAPPGENDQLHLRTVSCEECDLPLVAEWTTTGGGRRHLSCAVALAVQEHHPEWFSAVVVR